MGDRGFEILFSFLLSLHLKHFHLAVSFNSIIMAAVLEEPPKENNTATLPSPPLTLSSYIGLSFAIFLGFLPRSSISLISSLHSRNKALSLKLIQAEEQIKQMKFRRKEDSKANARVVEIFASHRNGWQQEEKKLLHQIEVSVEEIGSLRVRIDELEKSEAELKICVDKLQREVDEREEMINFMSRQMNDEDDEEFSVRSVEKLEVKKESDVEAGFYGSQVRGGGYGRYIDEENAEFRTNCMDFSRFSEIRVSEGLDPVPEECFMDGDSDGGEPGDHFVWQNGFSRDFVPSASKVWTERSSDWQDVRCDSLDSSYQTKHFVARRESPWKVDGESTGVPSKLKLLEQELLNLERIDKGELSKIPSLLRKQAKRYQALAGKIDDLCRRMQASDPSEPTLSSELRTQRQTEFLMEAYRLQQRAIEIGQKLTTLQNETTKSNFSNDHGIQAKLTTRRSLDAIRNNLKEIQRNLEVWLARIMGDLKGILSRDGASRVRDFYISRYPFVR